MERQEGSSTSRPSGSVSWRLSPVDDADNAKVSAPVQLDLGQLLWMGLVSRSSLRPRPCTYVWVNEWIPQEERNPSEKGWKGEQHGETRTKRAICLNQGLVGKAWSCRSSVFGRGHQWDSCGDSLHGLSRNDFILMIPSHQLFIDLTFSTCQVL